MNIPRTDLPLCLPVPPTVRTISLLEVTYAIERRSDGLVHAHTALYDSETGDLYSDTCGLGQQEDA